MDKAGFEQAFAATLRHRGSMAKGNELKEAVAVASWYVECRIGSFEEAARAFDGMHDADFISMCFLMGHAYSSYNDPNNPVAIFHKKCVEKIRGQKPHLTLFQLHMSADTVCNVVHAQGVDMSDLEPTITIVTQEQMDAWHERNNDNHKVH